MASRDLVQLPDLQGDHALHTASEEQFKVFTMPKVSAEIKVKLMTTRAVARTK